MNRESYLDELKQALQGYPEELTGDLLESFASHFAEGNAMGLTDQQIIDELGSIDEVVSSVSEMGEKNPEDRNEATSLKDIIIKTIRESVVHRYGDSAYRVRTEKGQQSEDTIAIPEGYRGVLVDSSKVALDLTVEASDQLSYSFTAYKNLISGYQPELSVSFNENVIIFKIEKQSERMAGSCELDLRIPQAIRDLFVNTASGDTSVRDLRLEEFVCHCAAGDTDITDCDIDKLTVRAVSGDVRLENVESRNFDISSVSGDVSLSGCTGAVTVNSVSGDVEVEDHIGSLLASEAVSGDINVAGSLEEVRIKAINGDSEIVLENDPVNVDIKASNGDICLEVTDFTRCRMEISANHGDVSLPEEVSFRKSGRTYIAGEGSGIITIKSGNGDITIR